ncbi:CWC16 protein [Entophlyctis helioformis]|nr:CWC16 protein [Entophlyctis helioformis]
MSERKVLNKYFPPDFDPSKIPRRKVDVNAQQKVRLMAPFSMQCAICSDYIYKGKKFNARKERSDGERYLGIQVFRFYIRCPKCAAEITFKTDPKNADYVVELGAVRNFEPWRDQSTVADEMAAERDKEEENNPMQALENRTLESKREMDIMDALDEIRTKNALMERSSTVHAADKIARSIEENAALLKQLQDEEDDRIAKAMFQTVDGEAVRRIDDDELEEIDLQELIRTSSAAASTSFDDTPLASSAASTSKSLASIGNGAAKRSAGGPLDLGIKLKKRAVEPAGEFKKAAAPAQAAKPAATKPVAAKPVAAKPAQTLGLLAAYGDSDEDE